MKNIMFEFNHSSEWKDEVWKEARYIDISNVLKIKMHATILFFLHEYSNFSPSKKGNIDLKILISI